MTKKSLIILIMTVYQLSINTMASATFLPCPSPQELHDSLSDHCVAGDKSACQKLALCGYETDLKKIEASGLSLPALLDKCSDGDADKCDMIGIFYYDTGNMKEAEKEYTKACRDANGEGCFWAGEIYDNGYLGGSLQADKNVALSFYKQSCNDNYSLGCSFVKSWYVMRLALTQGDLQTVKFYQKSCNDGSQAACHELKTMKEIE